MYKLILTNIIPPIFKYIIILNNNIMFTYKTFNKLYKLLKI